MTAWVQALLTNGAEMPDSLVSTLWNIIQRLQVHLNIIRSSVSWLSLALAPAYSANQCLLRVCSLDRKGQPPSWPVVQTNLQATSAWQLRTQGQHACESCITQLCRHSKQYEGRRIVCCSALAQSGLTWLAARFKRIPACLRCSHVASSQAGRNVTHSTAIDGLSLFSALA